jgi:hypothetical protein
MNVEICFHTYTHARLTGADLTVNGPYTLWIESWTNDTDWHGPEIVGACRLHTHAHTHTHTHMHARNLSLSLSLSLIPSGESVFMNVHGYLSAELYPLLIVRARLLFARVCVCVCVCACVCVCGIPHARTVSLLLLSNRISSHPHACAVLRGIRAAIPRGRAGVGDPDGMPLPGSPSAAVLGRRRHFHWCVRHVS